MTQPSDLAEAAKQIIDACRYLTLATADENGLPWVSPVWYASEDYREFLWVSSPAARHSRNLARRPEVAIVIFDSHQPPGAGEGVYLSARAEELIEDDIDRGIAIFSRRSQTHGAAAWTRSQVQPPPVSAFTTPPRSSSSPYPPPTNDSPSISTERKRNLAATYPNILRRVIAWAVAWYRPVLPCWPRGRFGLPSTRSGGSNG